ncbi:putative RING-H2 finger protein [Nymphaea thermarum]|nr:putative RING-H2 finger protein [Nymphaea thermarum]
MSIFNFSPSSLSSSPSPSTFLSSSPADTGTGLGYGIAIAVAILVLVSTTMLASYVCVRIVGRDSLPPPPPPADHLLPPTVIVVVPGLDDAAIAAYPKHCFSRSSGDDAATCAICLADYGQGDMLRQIPDCRHQFHVDCIDAWLRKSSTCPVCRSSPLPTPVATPLSEFVPLAAHRR